MSAAEAPTVEQALTALDNWASEHARVTAALVAETARARGQVGSDDEGPAH